MKDEDTSPWRQFKAWVDGQSRSRRRQAAPAQGTLLARRSPLSPETGPLLPSAHRCQPVTLPYSTIDMVQANLAATNGLKMETLV